MKDSHPKFFSNDEQERELKKLSTRTEELLSRLDGLSKVLHTDLRSSSLSPLASDPAIVPPLENTTMHGLEGERNQGPASFFTRKTAIITEQHHPSPPPQAQSSSWGQVPPAPPHNTSRGYQGAPNFPEAPLYTPNQSYVQQDLQPDFPSFFNAGEERQQKALLASSVRATPHKALRKGWDQDIKDRLGRFQKVKVENDDPLRLMATAAPFFALAIPFVCFPFIKEFILNPSDHTAALGTAISSIALFFALAAWLGLNKLVELNQRMIEKNEQG